MNRTQSLRKLRAYQKNPELIKEPSLSELADLVVLVLGSVTQIEQAIESKKVDIDSKFSKKSEQAITQMERDHVSMLKEVTQQVNTLLSNGNSLLNETAGELEQRVQQAIENIRNGDNGIVTEEEIERAASIALSMLELPDFDELVMTQITANGQAIRNALELLQGDERYKVEIADVANLEERLTQLRTQVGAGTIGKGQVYNFIRQAVADGTITTGGVSDEAYGPSWDGVTDEGASKNAIYDKIETLAGGHDPVTVTDSAEIDFTLTGQDITASLIAGSIDETKLDTSVNASLDLADSALQAVDIGSTVQGYDAQLAAIAGLVPGVEGRLIESDGLGGYQMISATNAVTNAGALMDSEVTNLAQVKAFDSSDYATAAQGATADSAVQPASPTLTGTTTVDRIDYDQGVGTVSALGNLGATETIDWATATHFTGNLDSNITFTNSNGVTGQSITLYLTYSGAQRTITWPTTTWLDNSDGSAPTAPATSGDVLVVTLQNIAGTIYGSATGNYAVYA